MAKKKPVRTTGAAKRPVRGAKSAANGHDTQHAVEQFLYRQADLLDEKRWQDYIDLFAESRHVLMPPEPSHTTWDGMPAIFAEDKNLMTVRMKRLLHPDAWSQRPLWARTTWSATSSSSANRRTATSWRARAFT